VFSEHFAGLSRGIKLLFVQAKTLGSKPKTCWQQDNNMPGRLLATCADNWTYSASGKKAAWHRSLHTFFKREKYMTQKSATYCQGDQRLQGYKFLHCKKNEFDRSITLFVEHLMTGNYVIVPATVSFVAACGDGESMTFT
jgi:hypothetical protein